MQERIEAARAEREQEILSLKEEIQNLKAMNNNNSNEKDKVNIVQENISNNKGEENWRQTISKQ